MADKNIDYLILGIFIVDHLEPFNDRIRNDTVTFDYVIFVTRATSHAANSI